MNPLVSIPAKYRAWLYAAFSVATVVMTYLGAKGLVGGEEMALFTGVSVLFGATALSNVAKKPPADYFDDGDL